MFGNNGANVGFDNCNGAPLGRREDLRDAVLRPARRLLGRLRRDERRRRKDSRNARARSIEPILTVIPREFTLGETVQLGIQRGKQRLPRGVIAAIHRRHQ